MATIDRMIKRMEKVKMSAILKKSFENTKDKIEEFQIGQMALGQNPLGKKIGKYKSKAYAQYKFQLSSLAGFGFIDLRLSGDLYREVFAQIKNSSVLIFSKVPYAEDIDKRYHPFGLSKQSRSTYVKKFLKPEFQKNLKRELRRL